MAPLRGNELSHLLSRFIYELLEGINDDATHRNSEFHLKPKYMLRWFNLDLYDHISPWSIFMSYEIHVYYRQISWQWYGAVGLGASIVGAGSLVF